MFCYRRPAGKSIRPDYKSSKFKFYKLILPNHPEAKSLLRRVMRPGVLDAELRRNLLP